MRTTTICLHGEVFGTLPIRDGEATADWTGLRYKAADEFGNPTDLTTGAAVVSTGAAPGNDGRYGWLGGKERSAEALAGVVLMGARLYDPGTGRFWSTDPTPGGNATSYDYCSADPISCTDLDGNWGWGWLKKTLKVAAVVGEVASMIPGPIGAAAGAISTVAYAATGNKAKAIEMGITTAAALVGAGPVVKAGAAALKGAGKVAAKVGGAALKVARDTGCNSFAPATGVLMADGSTEPISRIEVGDQVAARDPTTGELTGQPVLNVIVGVGDKHLISVTTAPASAGVLKPGEVADPAGGADTWVATATHPVWVDGHGWTDAKRLRVGELTVGATGAMRIITAVHDDGWLHGQTVYNLSVANVHTYIVGSLGDGTLVHNASVCQMLAAHVPRGPGVYTVTFKNGEHYVGRSFNMRARVNSHFHVSGKFSGQAQDVAHVSWSRGPRSISGLRAQEQARMDGLLDRGRTLRNKRREIG